MKKMTTLFAAVTAVAAAGTLAAQEGPPPSVGQLYESGRNQQVVEVVMAEGEAAPPDHLYWRVRASSSSRAVSTPARSSAGSSTTTRPVRGGRWASRPQP